MNRLTDKPVAFTPPSGPAGRAADQLLLNLGRAVFKIRVLNEDFGYHLIRAAMVIIFFFFGYQGRRSPRGILLPV